MRVSIISFTEKGMALSVKLAERLKGQQIRLYTKCSRAGSEGVALFIEEDLKHWAGRQMEERNGLVFIGACGIAVRAIAPHIGDKLHDSPVLVIDENGQYVIPILSGHVGGANELAAVFAEKLNALPVITTATDIRNVFAADIFARKNRLFIVNKDGIAKVSSKLLAGETITISIEPGHLETGGSLETSGGLREPEALGKPGFPKGAAFPEKPSLPEGILLTEYPPVHRADIVVTSDKNAENGTLVLRPREYVIGIGCRRGKEAEKIHPFITKVLKELDISVEQADALASVDLKSQEEGLLSWSRKEGIPFITYTPEELKTIEEPVRPSEFVKQVTGVDNVCERAALKAAGPGGKLIYEKHAEDGMTIAIARRKWRVRFDET